MTIATETISACRAVTGRQYQLKTSKITGCGFSYSAAELDAALFNPVADIVYDDSRKADIETLLSGLTETDFNKEF